MIPDFSNRNQVEHFMRHASAAELFEQRYRLESLLSQPEAAIADAERLIARIGYELRFRVAQPV